MTLNDLQRILSKLEGIGQVRRSQMKAIVQKATKDKSRTITFDVSIFVENEINFNLIVILKNILLQQRFHQFLYYFTEVSNIMGATQGVK